MKRSYADLHGDEYGIVVVLEYEILDNAIESPIHHGLLEKAREPALAVLGVELGFHVSLDGDDWAISIVKVAISADDVVHLLQDAAGLLFGEANVLVVATLLSEAEFPGGTNRIDYAVRERQGTALLFSEVRLADHVSRENNGTGITRCSVDKHAKEDEEGDHHNREDEGQDNCQAIARLFLILAALQLLIVYLVQRIKLHI